MTDWRAIERAIAGGYATLETFRGADPRGVIEIKSSLPFMARGVLAPKVRTVDKDKREVEFRASVEIVDRMGDLILLKKNAAKVSTRSSEAPMSGEGFRVQSFHDAGAPALWNHNSSMGHALPPIGQVTRSRFGTSEVPDHVLSRAKGKAASRSNRRPTLFQTIRFVDSEDVPFSRAAFLLVSTGVMRAVSVGFVPVVVDPIRDPEERKALGLGEFGAVFRESDQLELSVTPTPANPMALVSEDKAQASAVDRALADAVARGELEASLVADYRRAFPASATEARERLAAKLRSFVDLAADRTGQFASAYEFAFGEIMHPGEAPGAPETAEARSATDRTGGTAAAPHAPDPAATARQGSSPSTPLADVRWLATPWGGIGPPVVRVAGKPLEGARVDLETTDDGRAMRVRLILPDGLKAAQEPVEILGPCDDAMAKAIRVAMASPDLPAPADVPEGRAAFFIDDVGELLGAEPLTTSEQLLDQIRSLVIRESRRLADLEAVADALPDDRRDRCRRAKTPGQLSRLIALEIEALRQARIEQDGSDEDVLPPTENLWRAFDLMSDAANRLGQHLDTARGLTLASAPGGVSAGGVPRRSVEAPKGPTESTRASGRSDAAPTKGKPSAPAASDRQTLVDRARAVEKRLSS